MPQVVMASDQDNDVQGRVLAHMLEQGMSLRQALIAEGFSASNLARTVARWEKDADFNDLLVKGVRTSLATEAPALLKHALALATTSKSQFVQAEMTKWLLERAGLVPPRPPTEQAVLRAGSLTLNILPPAMPAATRVSLPQVDERPGLTLQAQDE